MFEPPASTSETDRGTKKEEVAKVPKLFRARRVSIGHLLVIVQSGHLKSAPKGIDPKLTCTVRVEGGAGDTEPMASSKQEWNTEFQFPISEYTVDVEVSLNTSRVDLVTQETRWIKEATTSFQVSVSERKPWKESKTEELQLSKGGKRKPVGFVTLSYRYIPRKNRWLQLEECILSPSAQLAKALLVVDVGLVSQQDYARALLTLFWFNGRERDLISMAVNHEIFTVFEKIDDITQLLRGPTLSSMILSEYMHIICEPYLSETLAPIIRSLATNPPQFELDPTKIESATPDKDLKRNHKNMMSIVNKVVKKLISSTSKMPPDMGFLCRLLKDAVTTRFPDNSSAWTIAMGALIFLRFICPALVSPKEFGLITNECAVEGTRCLILVSKVLTNLVNDVEFGAKEPYMVCMNDFLVKYKTKPMELYNNILKRKEGYLLEPKVILRAIDDETYTKLWKVIDPTSEQLCKTLGDAASEFQQIVSHLRDADKLEREEKEKAEAKKQRKEKRDTKAKPKTIEKEGEKDQGETPATPKESRKGQKEDSTRESSAPRGVLTLRAGKKDSTTKSDVPLASKDENATVETSPEVPKAASADAAPVPEPVPANGSNASEETSKSPKGKKKKKDKKTKTMEKETKESAEVKETNNATVSEGN